MQIKDKKMKICHKCGIEKNINEFTKKSSTKDGLDYTCKECNNEERKQHYKNNKEKIAEYQKKYRKDNIINKIIQPIQDGYKIIDSVIFGNLDRRYYLKNKYTNEYMKIIDYSISGNCSHECDWIYFTGRAYSYPAAVKTFESTRNGNTGICMFIIYQKRGEENE